MTSSNHEKHYCVESNFLDLKYFVCEMILPNFNKMKWKMEKRQLFQNRFFLALFILNWQKMNSSWRHYWFNPDFLYRKMFTLSQSNFVQNLITLTLKTKEGGGKHLPQCYTTPKSSVLIGLTMSRFSLRRFVWGIQYVIDKLRVAGGMNNKRRAQRGVYFS